MATFPVGVPAKRCFEGGIGAEFFGLHTGHHAVN